MYSRIGSLNKNIDIRTFQEMFEFPFKHDILIIDEIDLLLEENGFHITDTEIKGLWNFRDKKIYGFSATYTTHLDPLS